jgi:hypothetical protein
MQRAEMVFTLRSPLIKYRDLRFTGNVIMVHDLASTQETLVLIDEKCRP